MQAAMQKRTAPLHQPSAPLQLTVHVARSPLVPQTGNPLAGSPADVFSRTGVITATEPATAKVTFEGADTHFRNTLIMYKLDGNGAFKSAQAVFPNATAIESGGWMRSGRSSVEFELAAGERIGFALLPNAFSNRQSRELLTREDGKLGLVNWRGEPANLFKDNPESLQLVHIDDAGKMRPISGEYGNKLLHSAGNATAGIHTNYGGRDYADQLVDAERGRLVIGFDDKLDGGGAKRRSMVASIDLGRNNAAALQPPSLEDRPASFREMTGADRMASIDEIMASARMFDEDGDGRLNEAEWAKFAPLLNLTAEDHKHVFGLRGRGDIDSIAHLIRRGDANGDGRINEHELLEFRRRVNGGDPNIIQSFREAAGVDRKLDYDEFVATIQSFDRNGDGFDHEEWNRFAPILGMRPDDRKLFLDAQGRFDLEKFKAVFEVADTNGDGQLDPEEVVEMRRLALEFFSATDAAAKEGVRNGGDDARARPHFLPIALQPHAARPGHALGGWLPDYIAGLDREGSRFRGNSTQT